MNTPQTLIVTVGAVVAVGLILGFVLPYLKKKGVDVQRLLDQSKEVLAVANNAFDQAKPFLANADLINMNVFDEILSMASVAVHNVQQLHDSGQITDPVLRKEAARQYVIDSLPLIGVEVTEEVTRVIDGAIEAKVFTLKHRN